MMNQKLGTWQRDQIDIKMMRACGVLESVYVGLVLHCEKLYRKKGTFFTKVTVYKDSGNTNGFCFDQEVKCTDFPDEVFKAKLMLLTGR